jgi:phage-related protein
MIWAVEFFSAEAKAEVDRLPLDLRAKLERIVGLIQAKGLEQVREPYVKHLEGKLWEMRMSGRDGIARSIYVTASGRRIVILHTFIKKTDKTPRGALAIATARAKEIER